LQDSSFDFTPSYDDEEDEDEDEDDDDEDDELHIDPDSLGDWRTFRRNLAANPETAQDKETATEETTVTRQEQPNEKVLKSQNEELALEYSAGVWAHETSTVCTCYCTAVYCIALLQVECGATLYPSSLTLPLAFPSFLLSLYINMDSPK
jgi:hypothetical protein